MKTNIVIPSWSYWKEPTRAQPLTQLYLATILQDKGIDVEVTDLRDGKKNISKADLYLYTVASPDLREIQGVVKELKEQYPGAKHIAGGPHPTILPYQTDGFDTIVRGRGENALTQIVNDFPNLHSSYEIPVDYAKQKFPFPRRDFVGRDKIVTKLFKSEDIPSTTVLFSHGCPFDCGFCANYNQGRIVRRADKDIVKEIEYLIDKYDIKGLSLQDEICIPLTYTEAKKWAENIGRFNLKWRGQIRAGADSRIIDLAKDSGCRELSFGVESVSPVVLEKINKRIRLKDVINTNNDCKRNGIKTRFYLINGLPGEPEDIVNITKDFIERTNPDVVLLSTLQPYPGCDISNNPEKYGMRLLENGLDKLSHIRDSDGSLDDIVPFEYEKGFTRVQIAQNFRDLQEFLTKRGVMNK